MSELDDILSELENYTAEEPESSVDVPVFDNSTRSVPSSTGVSAFSVADFDSRTEENPSKTEHAKRGKRSNNKDLRIGDPQGITRDGSLAIPYDQDLGINPRIPNQATFDPRLAVEIAFGIERPEQIYPRYGLDENDWLALMVHPVFKKTVLTYQEELKEQGLLTFRTKARIQAEAYLTDAHVMIKHPMTPPAVKANMIQWMAKMGDLEPAKNGEQQGTTFQLQIVL